MTTALIDGDILIYKAACGAEKPIRWPDGVWTYSADEATGFSLFEGLLGAVLTELDTVDYTVCLSDPKENFRKKIYPQYKENRKSTKKPLLLGAIREYVESKHPCSASDTLEADDIMGVLATCGMYPDPVIVTIDKDLEQIPVKVYNPDKQEMSLPEFRDPYRFFMQQVLTGDPVDNFPGCPGIGKKTVDKLFKDINDPDALWGCVVQQYEKKGLTQADALVQARCAYILQSDNYIDNKLTMWGTQYE